MKTLFIVIFSPENYSNIRYLYDWLNQICEEKQVVILDNSRRSYVNLWAKEFASRCNTKLTQRKVSGFLSYFVASGNIEDDVRLITDFSDSDMVVVSQGSVRPQPYFTQCCINVLSECEISDENIQVYWRNKRKQTATKAPDLYSLVVEPEKEPCYIMVPLMCRTEWAEELIFSWIKQTRTNVKICLLDYTSDYNIREFIESICCRFNASMSYQSFDPDADVNLFRIEKRIKLNLGHAFNHLVANTTCDLFALAYGSLRPVDYFIDQALSISGESCYWKSHFILLRRKDYENINGLQEFLVSTKSHIDDAVERLMLAGVVPKKIDESLGTVIPVAKDWSEILKEEEKRDFGVSVDKARCKTYIHEHGFVGNYQLSIAKKEPIRYRDGHYNSTYVLPYRYGDDNSKKAVLAVAEWLKGLDGMDVLIIETGKNQTLWEIPNKVRYIFAYSPYAPNYAWLYNIGVRYSDRDIICFADYRLIPRLEDLSRLISSNSECCIAYPKIWKIREKEVNNFLEQLILPPRSELELFRLSQSPLLISIHRSIAIKIGGWDENVGLWPLCQEHFKKTAENEGIDIERIHIFTGYWLPCNETQSIPSYADHGRQRMIADENIEQRNFDDVGHIDRYSSRPENNIVTFCPASHRNVWQPVLRYASEQKAHIFVYTDDLHWASEEYITVIQKFIPEFPLKLDSDVGEKIREDFFRRFPVENAEFIDLLDIPSWLSLNISVSNPDETSHDDEPYTQNVQQD